MKNFEFIQSGFCVVLFLIVCVSATRAQPSPDAVPGVLIVKYKEDSAMTNLPVDLAVRTVAPAYPMLKSLRKRVPNSVSALQRINRVYYSAQISPLEAARLVSALSSVEYAEPLYPRVPYGERRSKIPNDPLFKKNTSYLMRMQLPAAWDIVKGEESDVTIAILDTGVDWHHEDLLDNLWTNPGEIPDNGIDDDGNGYIDDVHGWNFPKRSNDPVPNSTSDHHGTYVSGIASAVADDNVGMAGASWNAKFIPVNTNCEIGGNLCYTDEGVIYAAMLGADIINASYGSRYPRRAEVDVLQAAIDMGSLVIAAAGNKGSSQEYYRHYPGASQMTLSVCGTQPYSDINVFNYGFSIDVCAPGTGVFSTATQGEYHDNLEGTSYATPIVSGIAALVKTRFPNMSPLQLREQLRATADNIDGANDPSLSGKLGRGRVNAYRAVTETNAVSIRLTDWTLTDANGDGRYDPQEYVTVEATFVSYLSDVEGIDIVWGVNKDDVIITTGQVARIGPIKSGDSFTTTLSLTSTVNIPYKSFLFIEPVIFAMTGDIVSGGDAVRMIQ